MDEKNIFLKLFKIAQKQQKVLEKLAQMKIESADPIWYGKLDPNDPRRFDPLYGGEAVPEAAYHKAPVKQVHKPTNSLKPHVMQPSLPSDLKNILDTYAPKLKGSKIDIEGKNVSVRYNTHNTGGPTLQKDLKELLAPLGYNVISVIGETNPLWVPNYT